MSNRILPKLLPITPKELYLQLVGGTYDNIRQTNAGLTYIPAQFGGIFGQEIILTQGLVMEVTTFEVI
jgi:hypothetical protein